MSAAAAQRPFIISPWQDGLFFFASTLVIPLVWFLSSVQHLPPFYILAGVAVTSNGPHVISTWTRTFFDATEYRARPFLLLGVPVLIFAAVATITWKLGHDGARILNSTILYWATWHFVAQNWGILRIYQRKSGEPPESWPLRAEGPLLFLFVAYSLLDRIHQGPRTFFGVEVYWLPVPGWAIDALLAVVLAFLAVYLLGRLWQARAPWAPAAALRAAFLFCAFVGFFVPFRFITSDDTSGFAAAAGWHGFQYLGMIRFYHLNRWRSGVEPQARLISWLSQPGWWRGTLYFALLLAMAGAVYGVIYALSLVTRDGGWNVLTWGAVVWVSITLSHYYLDGLIWKLKRPEVARRVGLSPTPGESATA